MATPITFFNEKPLISPTSSIIPMRALSGIQILFSTTDLHTEIGLMSGIYTSMQMDMEKWAFSIHG
jgi:hypothetical protein